MHAHIGHNTTDFIGPEVRKDGSKRLILHGFVLVLEIAVVSPLVRKARGPGLEPGPG